MTKPRVGISRCLLGDEVRYDGGHKREPSLVEALEGVVEWIAVCPEVEVGMGVPREPIQLLALSRKGASDNQPTTRLVGVETGTDWTDRMQAWAVGRLDDLRALNLSGFILKARSPSCGLRDVPVEGAASGRGMFADALVRAMPDLPVEDEERLRDAAERDRFLARVLEHHRRG